MCGGNFQLDDCVDILVGLLRCNDSLKTKVKEFFDDDGEVSDPKYVPDLEICRSVKQYLNEHSCKTKEDDIKKVNAVLTAACTNADPSYSISLLSSTLGVNWKRMNTVYHGGYSLGDEKKVRSDCVVSIARECVHDFCHSDLYSRVDSKYGITEVLNHLTGQKVGHQRRVWELLTIDDKYDSFKSSEIMKEYQCRHPNLTIGRTRFAEYICKCTRNPTEESCVDVILTSVSEKMRAMGNVLDTKRSLIIDGKEEQVSFRKELFQCNCPRHSYIRNSSDDNNNWESRLRCRTEEFLMRTCCLAQPHPKLKIGDYVPKFVSFPCVEKNTELQCKECGIENVLQLGTCPTWNNCEKFVKEMCWREAARQGDKTQNELTEVTMTVPELLNEFKSDLETGRKHLVESKWSNWMRKIHVCESDEYTMIILTDFSAIANLKASKTDNSSVDNHAVLAVYYVVYDFRDAQYLDENKEKKIKKISTCDVWNWWTGGSSDQGKTNNHVTHNNCLSYILKYYKDIGKVISRVILWTDNCGGQYKCRQSILNMLKHAILYPNTFAMHLFASLYSFKGPWDSAGKLAKETVMKMELRGTRCPTAKEAYLTCLDRISSEFKISKWHKMEQEEASELWKKRPYSTDRRFFGFATDDKELYEEINVGGRHVSFIDRKNVPDMNAIKDTQKYFEFRGSKDILNIGTEDERYSVRM